MRASGSAELHGSHARASGLRSGFIVHRSINSASQHRACGSVLQPSLGVSSLTWAALRGGLFSAALCLEPRFRRLRAVRRASFDRRSAHHVYCNHRTYMTRTLIALALALAATSALAQDYNRQDLVRGLCQKDGCDEFAILSADRIKTIEDGTLFKTRLQTFHASYGGRRDQGQENGYVFCSPTRPAIMAEQSGQTMAFYLAPFATQESRESVRKNANFHALYFAICHGREAGKAAVHNLAGIAQTMAIGSLSPNPSSSP